MVAPTDLGSKRLPPVCSRGAKWALPARQVVLVAQDRVEVRGTESGGQPLELVRVPPVAVVQVGGLGDQAHLGLQGNPVPLQDSPIRLQVAGVDEQKLVLVQLYLDPPAGRHDRHAGTRSEEHTSELQSL